MLAAIIIIAFFLVASVAYLVFQEVQLWEAYSDLVEDCKRQEERIAELESRAAAPADLVINDIPVKYDAGSRTVVVDGNLVATGFVACGGNGGGHGDA